MHATSRSLGSRLLAAIPTVLFSLILVSDAHGLMTYSGRGIGVRAIVANGAPQTIADTGDLPATGGHLEEAVVDAQIPGLLGAAAVEAETTGAGDQSSTAASITDLDILLPGLGISVDLLQSEALATCTGTVPSVGGASVVVNLVIGGNPITIDGSPNQVVPLPLGLGQIVVNQQIASLAGSAGAIEVNALRLLVPSLGIDVKLASSHADVDCDAVNGCVPAPLFSGRATVVDADVLGVQNLIVDTGPLPSEGGVRHSSLALANLPGLLTAAELAATTEAAGSQSTSEATISDLALTVAGIQISAEVATSMAEAACTASGPTADGDAVIVDLFVAGIPIVVTGDPNQVVPLPLGLGHIVLNEQVATLTSGTAEMNATAIHVIVNGVADIAISRTHADVVCAVPDRLYGGQGVIARVQTTLPPINTTLGDTGALPANGGSLQSSLPNINLPAVLSTALVQSSADASGDQSEADALLANVNVLAGLVTATVIGSTAAATCDGVVASVAGGTQIANLVVAGIPIVVTGAPNQVVPLVGGTLVLNEQVSSVSGSEAEITVNALHLTLAGTANIVLASSRAEIDCDPNPSPPCPPEPTATPVPTPTPTPAPTATPTPPPTATPTPAPTATPTPAPTATPSPAPTPTPTPAPTATPTPTPPAPPPPQPTPAPQATASVCHHNCPDNIRLNGSIDSLAIKSGFAPTVVLDPANEAFRIVVSNANGVIYDASLLPGDLVLRGGNRYEFKDRNARKGTGIRDGLARVQIAPVPGGVGTRVIVDAFGDLSAATLSVMTVDITLGNDRIAYTAPWQSKPYGWTLPHR